MTTLSIGQTASATLAKTLGPAGYAYVSTLGGRGSVSITGPNGVVTSDNFGPAPYRRAYGPYPDGATVAFANASCEVFEYETSQSEVSGGGTGGLPAQIPASNVIPLNASSIMARRTISGPTAFTLGALSAGGSCVVQLLSDGVNVPTFPGLAWWSDAGYDNTQAGLLNTTVFWTDDGVSVWRATGQPAVNNPIVEDTTPPTLSSVTNTAGQTTVVLTFSEALSSTITGTATLSGPARTIVSQTVVGGNTVELVLSAAYAVSDVVTVSLPAGYVRDGATTPNLLAAVTNRSVVISAPVGTFSPMRLTALTLVTESGDGTAGWDYTGSGPTTAYNDAFGISTLSIPANAEGGVEYSHPVGSICLAILGLRNASTAGNYTTFTYGCQPIPGTRYAPQINGVSQTTNGTNVIPAAGQIVRFRRVDMTGGVFNIVLEISSDNRATWVVQHTFAGASAVRLWIAAGFNNSTVKLLNLRGQGLT